MPTTRFARKPGKLLERGMLRPGLRIMGHYKTERFDAIVEARKKGKLVIRVGDRRFRSLSGAASYVTGTQHNGWRFWRLAE
ncbi:MAG: DUF2924 domain-containing protein [Anaerolineales bacterium]|nr:MAG: DUF2924 domain-containing protein [Anaerolineales bacterium]